MHCRRHLLLTAVATISLVGATIVSAVTVPSAAQSVRNYNLTFEKHDPLTIGYSIYDLKQPYFQFYLKGVEAGAKRYGFTKVLISNEESSEQLMVTGSEELINEGISALVISPEQPSALPQIEVAAQRAHIPVIIGDVGTSGTYWQAFVLSNNYLGGQLAAQYLIKSLSSKPGPHEVAVIALRPTTSVRAPRTNGFVSTMSHAKGFKIVATVNGEETVSGGYSAMASLLAAHPHLQGVYCENDPEAEGASQELLSAGKNPMTSPVLVGFNGDPPALTLLKEHKLAADVAQNPYQQGIRAVEAAYDLLNGKPVPYTNKAAKEIEIPVQLVTPANVGEFITGLKTGKLY